MKVAARITALALACAMTVGGFIHMTATDPISVQNHNAIIMEAEAANSCITSLSYPKISNYYIYRKNNVNYIRISVINGYQKGLAIPNDTITIIIDNNTYTAKWKSSKKYPCYDMAYKLNSSKKHKITVTFENESITTKTFTTK